MGSTNKIPSFNVFRKIIESAFSADAGSMANIDLQPHINIHTYTHICIIYICIYRGITHNTHTEGATFCQKLSGFTTLKYLIFY